MSGSTSVDNNSAPNGAGIITIDGGKNILNTVTLSNNAVVSDNQAGQYGGGILLQFGKLTITDEAQVTRNTAGKGGGGVYGNGDNVSLSLAKTAKLSGNTAPENPDTNFNIEGTSTSSDAKAGKTK
jgi:predicted outer membrane repeat protein